MNAQNRAAAGDASDLAGSRLPSMEERLLEQHRLMEQQYLLAYQQRLAESRIEETMAGLQAQNTAVRSISATHH